MKKFEYPEIAIERYDIVDVLTVSGMEGTQIWEGYDGFTEPGDGGVEGGDDFDW